jgi:SAM-dependent methyltransferase
MYDVAESKRWILDWFHGGRLSSFADFIGSPGGRALSVGCGTARLETHYLSDRFEEITCIEPRGSLLPDEAPDNLTFVETSVPPIPFETGAYGSIVGCGVTEHIRDERGFVQEAHRVLSDSGALFLTAPIEVGIGGFIRHLGRCFVDPEFDHFPDGVTRYVDYSIEELTKRTPRDKNTLAHRYYNYQYLLGDLDEHFESVRVTGWPLSVMKSLNLILFISARK